MRKSKFILLGFICLLTLLLNPFSVWAQTTTWNGSVSTDWNTASNWSNGVPGSGYTAIITNQTNKPVLNTSATVNSIQFGSYYPGAGVTYLTVITGGSLTITNEMIFDGNGGSLHIDGGSVNHTGTAIDWDSNENRYIEMTSGSFSTNADFSITGGNKTTQPGFSVGSGTATFNSNLTISSSSSGKWFDGGSGSVTVTGNLIVESSAVFDLGTATLLVSGTTTVNGTFNGEDGEATFDGAANIESGGVLNLDEGNLSFNATLDVKGNGTANLGSGTVDINDNVLVRSSGYFNVQNATVNINGDAQFSNNGNLSVETGSINVAGDASVTSGGSMTLGGGNMNLSGDFEVTGGSEFNADSSTVTFSGDSTQTITTNGNNLTFNDVVVDSGATFQTDGNTENVITIEGDLTVNDGGSVNVQDDDQIDVQGEINGGGAGNVQSPAPFAISAVATDLNTLLITFNKPMVESLAENTANYVVRESENHANTITVNSATLNVGSDSTQVTLSINTIQEDIQYEVVMNNLESNDGGELSLNHIKRFTKNSAITFYSITSGNWASASTWSKTGHAGSPSASDHPGNTNNATIIVGDGDVVTIASSTSIVNQTAVQVNSGSVLRVGSGGVLTTGQKSITGSGTFQVTTGTLKIGSANGITTSSLSGNIRTSTRLYGTSGNYAYNGISIQQTGNGLPGTVQDLTIDNAGGVIFSNSSIQVNGTLYLTNGTFTIGSGKDLIANTKSIVGGDLEIQLTISGSNGWRLLSSPTNTEFTDLLDGTVTQGYPGAYYSTGTTPGDTLQPNVLFYDETHPGTDNQRWRAPENASNDVSPGLGLFTYIFGDIDADPNYNDLFPLPLTLSVLGQENEGPIDLGVTYTTTADSGWNLVGNPYAATIDWDDSDWTKTNIDQTIYVWDYSSGQFLTWNGLTGGLGDGLIAPFQGFWVKANAAAPSLIVEEEAKTTGGTYVGKRTSRDNTNTPMFSLTLVDDENREVTSHFMFSENAKIGKDPLDGYRLNPFAGIDNYIELSSISENEEKFSINNMPRHFGIPIEIPLHIEAYEHGFSVTKNMYLKVNEFHNIPDGWTITLIDHKESKEINIQHQPSYIFRHQGTRGKIASNANVTSRPKVQSKAKASDARFTLRIEPGADASQLPTKFTLAQNYPNPFNPTTNIQFSLPLQSYTNLSIYNILGQEVFTVVDEELPAGTHTFQWDASRLSSGVYLYRLMTRDAVLTKKMILIK